MPGTAFSAANWSDYDEASFTALSSVTDFTFDIHMEHLSASFGSTVQSDFGDVRVTKEDGTELSFALIDPDYNGGSPTGRIRVLFTGASGTSANKVRVWTGYSSGTAIAYDVTETYGSDNAFDDDWLGYWPLQNDFDDYTSSGWDMTGNGGISAGGISGKFGAATDFDGSDDYLSKSHESAMNSDAITVMAWVTGTETTNWQGVLQHYDSLNGYAVARRGASDDISVRIVNGSVIEARGGGFSSTWKQYICTANLTDAEVFENNSSVGTASGTVTSPDPTAALEIGRSSIAGDAVWDGGMQDVQLHGVVRDSAWRAEEYSQTNDNASYWTTWAHTTTGGGGSIIPQVMHHRRLMGVS